MLFAIIAIIVGYRKARDSGRNGFLWAAICGVTFIVVQLLIAFGIGVIIGVGAEFAGWNETLYDDYGWVITILSIVFSIGSILLIFKYLDRIPDEPLLGTPPPPPVFESNDQNL